MTVEVAGDDTGRSDVPATRFVAELIFLLAQLTSLGRRLQLPGFQLRISIFAWCVETLLFHRNPTGLTLTAAFLGCPFACERVCALSE